MQLVLIRVRGQSTKHAIVEVLLRTEEVGEQVIVLMIDERLRVTRMNDDRSSRSFDVRIVQ